MRVSAILLVLIIGLVFSGCARKYSTADDGLATSIAACQTRMGQETSAKYNKLTDPKDIMLQSSIDGLIRGQAGYVDPCAQIKTHIHAEIAHSEFQGKIWEGFWSTAKVGLIGTFTYLSLDSFFDTMAAAAAGSRFTFETGEGDIAFEDSFKDYQFGDMAESSVNIDGSTATELLFE